MRRVSAYTSEGEGEVISHRLNRGRTEILVSSPGFSGWYLQGSFTVQGEACPECHEGTLLPYDPHKNNSSSTDFSTIQPDAHENTVPTQAVCDVCGHTAPLSDADSLPASMGAAYHEELSPEDHDLEQHKKDKQNERDEWGNYTYEGDPDEEIEKHSQADWDEPDLDSRMEDYHADWRALKDIMENRPSAVFGKEGSPLYAYDEVTAADAREDEEDDDADDDGVYDNDGNPDDGGDSDKDSEDDENSKNFGKKSFLAESDKAPYYIRDRGGKSVVINDDGEVKSSFDSHEEALKYQRALMLNVPGAVDKAKEDHDKSGHPKNSSIESARLKRIKEEPTADSVTADAHAFTNRLFNSTSMENDADSHLTAARLHRKAADFPAQHPGRISEHNRLADYHEKAAARLEGRTAAAKDDTKSKDDDKATAPITAQALHDKWKDSPVFREDYPELAKDAMAASKDAYTKNTPKAHDAAANLHGIAMQIAPDGRWQQHSHLMGSHDEATAKLGGEPSYYTHTVIAENDDKDKPQDGEDADNDKTEDELEEDDDELKDARFREMEAAKHYYNPGTDSDDFHELSQKAVDATEKAKTPEEMHAAADLHDAAADYYEQSDAYGQYGLQGKDHREYAEELREEAGPRKTAQFEVVESAPKVYHEYIALLNSDPFIKETAWKDVRTKGIRLRSEGRLAVDLYEPHEVIQATVDGDSGTYTTVISTGKKGQANIDNHIAGYSCTCKWGKWAFTRETYFGRLCAHGVAAHYEKQALDRSGKDRVITEPYRLGEFVDQEEELEDDLPTHVAATEDYIVGSDDNELNSETILANFQRDAAYIIEGNNDDDDLANAADAFLEKMAKTSGKQYSAEEQLALIYEGGDASNIDDLNLENSNYILP